MPFLTRGYALDNDGLRHYRLLRPVSMQGSKGDVFTAPVGFRTDLASVPKIARWLFSVDDKYTLACIIHDYLYWLARQGKFSFHDADGIFRLALKEEHQVSDVTRWAMWAAVRIGSHMKGANRDDWVGVTIVALYAAPLVVLPCVLLLPFIGAYRLLEKAVG